MRLRILRLLPAVLCLGCTVLTGRPEQAAVEEAAEPPAAAGPTSLPPPPARNEPDWLAKAAAFLSEGNDAAALPCLTRYVESHPDHVAMRAHLAELLLRLKKPAEARAQLERYETDAARPGEPAAQHLVHCHTRLVEIARAQGDAYSEHLHRGLGLFRVAEGLLSQDDGATDPRCQRILFQAIAELKLAAAERPGEPRPHWYLHECWAHLGQSQPAREHLARTRRLAAAGGLTAAEEQALALER